MLSVSTIFVGPSHSEATRVHHARLAQMLIRVERLGTPNVKTGSPVKKYKPIAKGKRTNETHVCNYHQCRGSDVRGQYQQCISRRQRDDFIRRREMRQMHPERGQGMSDRDPGGEERQD